MNGFPVKLDFVSNVRFIFNNNQLTGKIRFFCRNLYLIHFSMYNNKKLIVWYLLYLYAYCLLYSMLYRHFCYFTFWFIGWFLFNGSSLARIVYIVWQKKICFFLVAFLVARCRFIVSYTVKCWSQVNRSTQ